MTIAALALSISAFITAGLCLAVTRQYRGRMVQLDWRFFFAMGLGALGIGLFYLAVADANWNGNSTIGFVPFSRILWGLVIFSTAAMAYSVLSNGKSDE